MTGWFCKKEEYSALKTSLVSQRSLSLFMFSSLWDDVWLVKRHDFDGRFSLRRSDWPMSRRMPGWSSTGKNIFPRAKRAPNEQNPIQTLFEFVEKLTNLDEKVIWSFLTPIAKNKLAEKGTLSLISNGVPFLMNARIGLILVLEGIVFHYTGLRYLFGTVTIHSDILF